MLELHAASVPHIRIYMDMMLDSTVVNVVCRRALGCEWGGECCIMGGSTLYPLTTNSLTCAFWAGGSDRCGPGARKYVWFHHDILPCPRENSRKQEFEGSMAAKHLSATWRRALGRRVGGAPSPGCLPDPWQTQREREPLEQPTECSPTPRARSSTRPLRSAGLWIAVP